VEFLQKPVSNKKLLDTIEQRDIYEQLERLNIDTEAFKKAGFNHEVLKKILTNQVASTIYLDYMTTTQENYHLVGNQDKTYWS
jgi:FixJ family two-component response regulator